MSNQKDMATLLTTAFDRTLQEKYGHSIPPPPFVTPFGIKHLDTLLGGGITSSSPVAFSSTPETGKSTCAIQFCATFQAVWPDATVVYLDTESAAGGESRDIEDRIETFGINREKFLYKPIVMDLKETFELVHTLVDLKGQLKQKTGKDCQVLFVLDSIAATASSKDASAEDPNEVIGFKARELTFNLSKCKQDLSMHQITFIVIDQVRSNIQIKSAWQAASDEKTVGTFGNFKSATNVSALQHNIRQWLWLSKGAQLKPQDPMGVDGWILNVFTEKNKLAPSQYSIPLIFDKKYGVIPIWSEYYFLANKTKTENKFWPKEKKMPYPLLISGATNRRKLEVINPETGEVQYTSDTFDERKFIQKYNTDESFRQWFDYAVHISAQERIIHSLFRTQPKAPVTEGEREGAGEIATEEEASNVATSMNLSDGEFEVSDEAVDDYSPEEYPQDGATNELGQPVDGEEE